MITLYCNTQTDGEQPSDVYHDQWQLSPYSPASMFCQGFTAAQEDYLLPAGYELVHRNGKDVFQRASTFFDVCNDTHGNPALCVVDTSDLVHVFTKVEADTPKESIPASAPRQSYTGWVPRMTAENEWEIV